MKTAIYSGLAIFLFGIFSLVSVPAQEKPILAPFFSGESLPTPPQQLAPWHHGDDMLSNAAATLFDQGLADPRGLEYREIEIGVGEPWNGGGYVQKTHGWVLPPDSKGGQFAVAWNGLIYPVVSIGNLVDLRTDWKSGEKGPQDSGLRVAAESYSVGFNTPSTLKLVMLLRLGEDETVGRIAKAIKLDEGNDRYLDLANDWVWFAFERAACAHERGDDRLALVDARLLTRIQPLVEAEAKRRGFKPPDFAFSGKLDRPYLQFLDQLPILLSDSERRVASSDRSPTHKDDIPSLIADLQNVEERQWGQPGGVSLAQDPRVQELVKHGDEVVEPLLDAMENDKRLTRSVSFHRNFFRGRYLIPVSDAAYAALVDLLHVDFHVYGLPDGPVTKEQLAAAVRAYWTKMGKLPLTERFYATLKDDKAGKDQWLQAAANIIQPTDVESHGGWTTVPNRIPGQKIELRGESLRDGRGPSVTELMARRSDEIASIRTNSTMDHFLYIDAGRMALHLADWDPTAAIPALKKRLTRAWEIGKEPNDILAFNGNPVEHFGAMIAKMTLARVRCGDETAYDEYAAWIQKAEFRGVSFDIDELQKPLIQGMDRPSIARAADYLFNDPRSPWSNVFARNNGFWLDSFWRSSLPLSVAFRKRALRDLSNDTPAGMITFNPREEWNTRGEAVIEMDGSAVWRRSEDDSDAPPSGEKHPFRINDLYAYYYSRFQNGPKFQLYWPKEKRDAGVQACRKWLEARS